VCKEVGEVKKGVEEEMLGGGNAVGEFDGTNPSRLPSEFLRASKLNTGNDSRKWDYCQGISTKDLSFE
jgi:hypothetical protein